MSSILRHWKNQLRCPSKHNTSKKSSPIDNECTNLPVTLEKLHNENRLFKDRFDKLEERCQRWIGDEQVYLSNRIQKLENENHQLHANYQTYQIQNEKCIKSLTDLVMKILFIQQTNKRLTMLRRKKQRLQKLLGQCFLPCNDRFTPQELRKQYVERHNDTDAAQWRKKKERDESVTRNSWNSAYKLDDSRYTTNDQSAWHRQQLIIVDEQDQQTANYSSESNIHSSTLATAKSKSNQPSTGQSNKLYFALNYENTPALATRNNQRSSYLNIAPGDDSKVIHHNRQSSTPPTTLNKNRSTQQQNRTHSNHERLPTPQTPYRTSPVVKVPPAKATPTVSRPVRVSITTTRPPASNIQQRSPRVQIRPPVPSPTNQRTVLPSSTPNKSPRFRYTLAKSPEALQTINTTPIRSRPGQTTVNKPKISIVNTTTNNTKTRIPIVVQQSARVTDLDVLMAEQQVNNKSKRPNKPIIVSSPPIVNIISRSLFSKNTVKVVRPVRSQELKVFSSHLTPETSFQTNESLSTLTPPSLESIIDIKPTDNQLLEANNNSSNSFSNVLGVIRDFSEDSLNEHHHIQKLLKQNTFTKSDNVPSNENVQTSNGPIPQETIDDRYFLLTDNNLRCRQSQSSLTSSSSLRKSKAISPSKHRLVFPARLGRMVFYRRILSDSDIYQKNCSKDDEIYHNVYHLDTIRDYSMEFYMITTYASDSQLRAWIDSTDDEIVKNMCSLDENRCLSTNGDDDDDDDDEVNKNEIKRNNSIDSLMHNEELDWYSELEAFDLSSNNQQKKNDITLSCSSEDQHGEELLRTDQFFTSNLTMTTSPDSSISKDFISTSSLILNDTPPTQLDSSQLFSSSSPLNIVEDNNLMFKEILSHSWTDHSNDQFENGTTSSVLSNEFQSDFYYLCPLTNTTNFSKTDHAQLYNDV